MESSGITFGPELCIHCPLLPGSLLLTLLLPVPFSTVASAILGSRGRLRWALGVPLALVAVYLSLGSILMVSRFDIDWRRHREDYAFVQVPWASTAVLAAWGLLVLIAARFSYRWASRLVA